MQTPQVLLFLALAIGGTALLSRALRRRPRAPKARASVRSKLAAAPTGYVEIEGFAWPIHEPVTSLKGSQAVYHSIKLQREVRRASGREWVTCWSRTQRDPFFVADATGAAILRPEGAEFEIVTRRVAWNRISKKAQEDLVSGMFDVEIPSFPPARGLLHALKPAGFRLVEEEIPVGAPLAVMGAFQAGPAPIDLPPELKRFAGFVNERVCGEIRASGETPFLIADRRDEPALDLSRGAQAVAGGLSIAIAAVWAFTAFLPWAQQRRDEIQKHVALEAGKNKPNSRELKRRQWRLRMARLDRRAFGLRAEEIPSTSFDLNDPAYGKSIPLALSYGVFLIEPRDLRVLRYDDDLRGVGGTPGLLHVSDEGQVVVQDLNRRLVVLDLRERTRTPYPFQAAAAIIEGGELYWVRVENQLARVYRTRVRDFETVELASKLSFPERSTAEFIRVSEKLHLVTRDGTGRIAGQFEILLNGLNAAESPRLSRALTESEERLRRSCPDCEGKNEPVSAKLASVGQLNVVYEIYTKRIFWIGNGTQSRLISSAGPPFEERLEGADCQRQPQRCLSLEASDRLEYFGGYGREYWARETRSLHYLCMAAGGRACEALLFALEGKSVPPAVREQYLWASCRTANAFSCRELIRRNVPYKGWAEFAMGNFLAFEPRLPANSVEGVDMVEEPGKND